MTKWTTVRSFKNQTDKNYKKKKDNLYFNPFRPVTKCDNLNSTPTRKFGRKWQATTKTRRQGEGSFTVNYR